MLSNIKLRHFRCFESLECEFVPGANVIYGPNAQGKTSLLEAACVLLRLQSQRVTTLARAIQHGKRSFVLDGHYNKRHLQFYFSRDRKKLALDSVEQKSATEYLQAGRVVFFSNHDIDLVRGAAEKRRRFLDFVAVQVDAVYRKHLRDYERALRSRNVLLKAPQPKWREIVAFDQPLIEAGDYLAAARRRLLAGLQSTANEAQRQISGSAAEKLELKYMPGFDGTFASALEAARPEDLRLRQTNAGPHRDDVALILNDRGHEFASEGQQRSLVLSLRVAQARLIEAHAGETPLFLMDDIFGELDVPRRNALLAALPPHAQKLISTTHVDWMQTGYAQQIRRLSEGTLTAFQ
ncbi:MAG TPA: DNA replication and repair protein RecF [Chthoniobacteraceae bacterium]|nr:DNA replication and repair protein RecF [Chthoniobacteraceae bacterium]